MNGMDIIVLCCCDGIKGRYTVICYFDIASNPQAESTIIAIYSKCFEYM